ncbi:hypothetical protein F5883DRAFT_590722, partial [Diaporthe sp. PMI_573]
MSGRQSYLQEARRREPTETGPPPSYHEAVNAATPSRPQDGPSAPRSPSHPNGDSSQTTSLPAARSIALMAQDGDYSALGREIRRQIAARLSSDSVSASAEPGTHVRTTEPITQPEDTPRRHETTEGQRETTQSKNGTSGIPWQAMINLRKKVDARDRMIKRRDKIIKQKNEIIESMSARLAAAEAKLVKEEQEATYLRNVGSWALHVAEAVFRMFQTLL